jgi:hypothetical protein
MFMIINGKLNSALDEYVKPSANLDKLAKTLAAVLDNINGADNKTRITAFEFALILADDLARQKLVNATQLQRAFELLEAVLTKSGSPVMRQEACDLLDRMLQANLTRGNMNVDAKVKAVSYVLAYSNDDLQRGRANDIFKESAQANLYINASRKALELATEPDNIKSVWRWFASKAYDQKNPELIIAPAESLIIRLSADRRYEEVVKIVIGDLTDFCRKYFNGAAEDTDAAKAAKLNIEKVLTIATIANRLNGNNPLQQDAANQVMQVAINGCKDDAMKIVLMFNQNRFLPLNSHEALLKNYQTIWGQAQNTSAASRVQYAERILAENISTDLKLSIATNLSRLHLGTLELATRAATLILEKCPGLTAEVQNKVCKDLFNRAIGATSPEDIKCKERALTLLAKHKHEHRLQAAANLLDTGSSGFAFKLAEARAQAAANKARSA